MSATDKPGPGKPTVVTTDVVALLISAFQDGLNVTQACWQAGIGRDAYYDRYNVDPEFADKMDRAREFPSMNSRKGIVKAIKNGDVHSMKWWLERRSKDEFSTRQEVTGRGGRPFNEPLSPEEKAKVDSTLRAKAEREAKPDEADRPTDPGVGGTEGQSVS